jgi:uncharacterized repeat protein (TIGR01451 family)
MLIVALSLLSSVAWPATPPNTPVTNTATANYRIGSNDLTASSTITVNTAACTTVGTKVELMQYLPSSLAAQTPAGAGIETVMPTGYAPGGSSAGPFFTLGNPTLPGNSLPIPLPANLLLMPLNDATGKMIASFTRNEPIFIRVTRYDANLNPAAADTVVVKLTTSGGDSEVLQLTETGLSTGIFIGSISSVVAQPGTVAIANDGKISITSPNETISVIYNYANCTNGTNIANINSGLIDPYGIVFDAKTGTPINGVQLSLVSAQTNQPAIVYCDDGVTVMPQPVISGSPTICDATMAAGSFHFHKMGAGNFKLLVTPPPGHQFPSLVAPVNLPPMIGTPAMAPVILGNPGPIPGGSYGGIFTLTGSALKMDIPLDPGSTSLTLQKTAGKAVVGTGEFIPYILSVANNNATAAATGALIADHLPPGFRYQKGSTRLENTVVADPLISPDASTLTFSLNLLPAKVATLHYVLEVTAGARTGTAENTAVAIGGFSSNTAHASVLVREDLFRNKAMLVGRVIDGACDNPEDEEAKGLANARVVLQDGSYVLTDRDGRWHIDNLRPGTHVVQLDMDSLPKDYEIAACEQNTRFAGRLFSQFVTLHGGSLWRADFHVQKIKHLIPRLTQTLSAKFKSEKTTVLLTLVGSTTVDEYSVTVLLPESAKYSPGSARLNGVAASNPEIAGNALIFRSNARPEMWQDQYSFSIENVAYNTELKSLVRFTPPGRAPQNLPIAQIALIGKLLYLSETFAEVPPTSDVIQPALVRDDDPNRLVEKLPYDETWLANAPPGNEWLHPQENFSPNLPVIKVAVKHDPAFNLVLSMNGKAVNPLLFEGMKINASHSVSLSTWNAVPLNEGDNHVELLIKDVRGKEISRTSRNIHYASALDNIEFIPQQSLLLADGKTRPIIAVRFLDKQGYPLRRGVSGEFQLNDSYQSHDSHEGRERDPLTGQLGGKPRFEIHNNGLALIELEPTTQSGEVILTFQFNDQRTQEARAWLEAGQRDWILVGFGEGTLGHKTLSGNIQALQTADMDNQLFEGNQLAFYAKGSIRGDTLLTLAYDTAKQTGNPLLKQAVDPTQYYTLYADASQTRFDAASASRLYVKLERKQFYAMFGDYDTGLSVTELSRYSRTLNGIKSEYKGEKASYNAFASVTSQAYIKDEIPGNGTSGMYKLSRGNLLINSDKIRIETRDRFQSQIIVSTQNLTRYLDYDLDYALGTLTFHEPVTSRDSHFNPTYIVVEYESADAIDKAATFGGRASVKAGKDIEIGATIIHEGTVGAIGDLQGGDISYQPDIHTRLRVEGASTQRTLAGVDSSGSAWLGEITHHEEQWDTKVYMREQATGFGLGQQSNSEMGTGKMGADGRLKLSDTLRLQGQIYRQENLSTQTNNSVQEARADLKLSADLGTYFGARTAQSQNIAGNQHSNQLIAGATYVLPDKKLALHGAAEIGSGTADNLTMPDRLLLGADYKVTEQTKLFAEQEFARGEQITANTTRAGIRTQPWSGGEIAASLGNSSGNDAERLYTNYGLVQRWQINPQWQSDFSVDRSRTLYSTAVPLNLSTPPPSGLSSATGLLLTPEDYTATTLGVAYHDSLWSGNGRIEFRDASINQQQNLQLGLRRDLAEGNAMATGLTLRTTHSETDSTRNSDLRFSYAHRPNKGKWIWFDRVDYITQFSQSSVATTQGEKWVNNLNANTLLNRQTQFSLQYGAKYVLDNFDGNEYKGYTDLIGTEIRYDITRNWDIGIFASVMRSLNAGVTHYGMGASLGYNLTNNVWLSLGYNLRGLNDRDFIAAAFRERGMFITLRVKVDQDTFNLNKGRRDVRPMIQESRP